MRLIGEQPGRTVLSINFVKKQLFISRTCSVTIQCTNNINIEIGAQVQLVHAYTYTHIYARKCGLQKVPGLYALFLPTCKHFLLMTDDSTS